ncbi:hypothetical protein PanWU01x14_198950, partial [Parasponia andersonii]
EETWSRVEVNRKGERVGSVGTRFGALYIGPLARHHMGAEKSVSQCLMGVVKVKYNGARRGAIKDGIPQRHLGVVVLPPFIITLIKRHDS